MNFSSLLLITFFLKPNFYTSTTLTLATQRLFNTPKARMVLACCILGAIILIILLLENAKPTMKLVRLADPLALCLDGSPGAYYEHITPNATKWIFWMQGGGWCYSPNGCLGRSHSALGSSTGYAANVSRFSFAGPMSPDCDVNPQFCDFNLIHLQYCDGASFSGALEEPVHVNSSGKNSTIYFRGAYIRRAVIQHLISRGLLSTATEVLVGGDSAGGLATFLHADAFKNELSSAAKNLTKFKALPVSGYFPMHANYNNQQSYVTRMKAIFELAGVANGGVNTRCLEAMREESGEDWRCMFAETVTPFINVDTFALQSRMDAWSLPCILAASMELTDSCYTIPPFTDVPCPTGPPLQYCFPGNLSVAAISYSDSMLDRIVVNPLFSRAGSGIFLSSGFTHSEGIENYFWTNSRIQGVSMRDAAGLWWSNSSARLYHD